MESAEEEQFYKSVVVDYSVQKIEPTYYILTGLYKAPAGNKTITDTTWIKEK